MSPLAQRILEVLNRRSMSAAAVGTVFDISEEEATNAVDELLQAERAFRHGSMLIAAMPRPNDGAAPLPAGQQRQVDTPTPASPRPRPAPPNGPPPQRQKSAAVAQAIAAHVAEATAAAVPRETQESSSMKEKTCRGACGESKPATTEFFYKHPASTDGLDGVCKICKYAAQKARKKAGANGSAVAKKGKTKPTPRSAKIPATAPARARPLNAVAPLTGAEELAILSIPSGFRVGPLHRTLGGLMQMPYHIDLSFDQVDELTALRKAVAA